MHILHFNDHLRWAGGIETWLLTVVPLLEKQGMRSTVAYAKGDAELLPQTVHLPGLISNRFTDDAAVRREVFRQLDAHAPDILHLHGIQNLGAMNACLDSGIPTILTGHDFRTICPASMFYHKRTQTVCERTCGRGCFSTTVKHHCLTPRPRPAAYYYRRARWTMRHAHRFAQLIAPSHGAAKRFAAAGFAQQAITVLPYFCPMPVANTPRPIPERPTLTFIGRLAENKGWQVFIKALTLLPETWQGLIVGPITPAIEARLKSQNLGDRLRWQPWAGRDEVRAILQRTTVFSFPSLWPETLGIVGLEALSQGVPVVASDIGGVRQWLQDGENGKLVPPGDAQALANAAQALNNRATQERYGKQGLNTIRDRFLAETHIDRLRSLYAQTALS